MQRRCIPKQWRGWRDGLQQPYSKSLREPWTKLCCARKRGRITRSGDVCCTFPMLHGTKHLCGSPQTGERPNRQPILSVSTRRSCLSSQSTILMNCFCPVSKWSDPVDCLVRCPSGVAIGSCWHRQACAELRDAPLAA